MNPIYSKGFHGWVGERYGLEARHRLDRYAADLLRFNRAQNLVSRTEPEARVGALIEECALALDRLGSLGLPRGPWVDVGTGGGLPGLVWSVLDPTLPLLLVERRRGRCDFLRREIAALGLLGARVSEGEGSGEVRGTASLATAKAVTPPPAVFDLLEPWLAPGGSALLFHRAGWGLEEVPPGWSLVDRRVLRMAGDGPESPAGYLFRRD